MHSFPSPQPIPPQAGAIYALGAELRGSQTTITPSAEGLLSGKTVAIKDNVSVAGLPMTGGTQPFHLSKDTPYPISGSDAPVVTRVLEAGGTITGTSTCENYCMSALSFSSATGPVDNPWLKGYACGGSSSGSAALVGVKSVKKYREKGGQAVADDDLGEGVDLAIGGDQGGSIRMVSNLWLSLRPHYHTQVLTNRPAGSV